MSIEEKLGEIHGTVKALDKKLDQHLENHQTLQTRVGRVEGKQNWLFGILFAFGSALGGGASAIWEKIT